MQQIKQSKQAKASSESLTRWGRGQGLRALQAKRDERKARAGLREGSASARY